MLGKHVLVTRPHGQGEKLCLKLEAQGFTSSLVPVLAIEPIKNPQRLAVIEKIFSNIADYDGIIFVSLNAVEQALPWFKLYPYHSGQKFYAVGKTTADFFERFFSGIPISFPAEQMDSEGLLALPEFQNVTGKKFLLLRGEGGRELIAETLRKRGARLDSCELYRRFCPLQNTAPLQKALVTADAVLINSLESLENFLTLSKGGSPPTSCFLIVPSNRIARAAQTAGFKHIIITPNATDDAVLLALAEAFHTGELFP